jgi:hypothetical protein
MGARAAACGLALVASLAMAAPVPPPAKPLPPVTTLEQAVARVQQQTRGKVLQADTRRLGAVTEFRIKVLTPEGHVRVVPVRTQATKAPTARNDKEKR